MDIIYIGGQIVDREEIRGITIENDSIGLTFRNGDTILLGWRDEAEKNEILRTLQTVPMK